MVERNLISTVKVSPTTYTRSRNLRVLCLKAVHFMVALSMVIPNLMIVEETALASSGIPCSPDQNNDLVVAYGETCDLNAGSHEFGNVTVEDGGIIILVSNPVTEIGVTVLADTISVELAGRLMPMVKGIHLHLGQVQVRMVREHSTLHQGLDTVVEVEMAPVGEWEVSL